MGIRVVWRRLRAAAGTRGKLRLVLVLHVLLLIITISASVIAIITASRQTSPTFDEIVLMAGGARGYETGRFDLAPDHPPLMQYVYGLPIYLSTPNYPDESQFDSTTIGSLGYRYLYARLFFFRAGNDPERVAAQGRLPAAAIAAMLMLLVFGFASRWGTGTGVLAAALTAFLPDVLAHGGVAYNDLPLAAGYLGAIWAADSAVRKPTIRRAMGAGAVMALAVSTKISGVIVLPVAVCLLLLEAVVRRGDRSWSRAVTIAAFAAVATAYLTIVLIYAGDWGLDGIRYALSSKTKQAAEGHGAYAFLLGRRSAEGWWYYFPVAFLFKTSAGMHALLLLALAGFATAFRQSASQWCASRLRGPVVGIAAFSSALLLSNLNIGFRYALPVLPLVVIIAAVGCRQFLAWSKTPRWARAIVVAASLWSVAFSLSYYPNFLSFVSEYGPRRDHNAAVFGDSSLDWGQGLLQLRDWLASEGNPLIYLSYFGSALPDAYGIDYVAAPSYFPLLELPKEDVGRTPRYLVVSATNLQGTYLVTDPFRRLREQGQLERVIAGSLLVYRWE